MTRATSARRRAARMVRRSRRASLAGEGGSATIWLLLLIPALMVAAGLVVDGGRSLAVRQQLTGLAAEGARVAVDRVDPGVYRDTNAAAPGGGGPGGAVAPGSAQAAACSWVQAVQPGATCAATAGADGKVSVVVSVRYDPVLLVGFGSRSVTGRGTARPAVGVESEVEYP